ncbi:MAG: stage III sporulation protein AG [Candidatus Heteroscillospira sp.]|jgi:stage III sporulation protein AG
MKLQKLEKILKPLRDNPYVLAVLALGLVLMLLPSGEKTGIAESRPAAEAGQISPPCFSVLEEQERLRETLESISGVGRARVLLSVKNTETRNLAQSEGQAVIVSAGSGRQQAVESGFSYPDYLGAVVVCQGAGSAQVRLQVSQAVSAFTGLGAAKIQVLKMD